MDYLERMRERIEERDLWCPAFLGDKDNLRKFADMVGALPAEVLFSGRLQDL